jgi:hypothetical protein
MDKNKIIEILEKHLPKNALSPVADLIIKNQVYLNITKSRTSKFGDFRVAGIHQQPKLSINYNLNPYSFLITLLHEMAHLLVWRNYKMNYTRIKPHGKEWKAAFKELMRPFLIPQVFPEPLLNILKKHMLNPKASSASDIYLLKELRRHDTTNPDQLMLLDFKLGEVFTYRDVKFKILKKNRSRFLCEEITSRRKYLVHSMVEVQKAI